MDTRAMNFYDLEKFEIGTILATVNSKEWIEGLIVRGPVSLCAYIGFPVWHPLSKLDYDNIPLNVHGGLTFCGKGDGKIYPLNKFWIGWDYAHWGDTAFYELKRGYIEGTHGWTTQEVIDELKEAMSEFNKLFWFGWVFVIIKRYIHSLTA